MRDGSIDSSVSNFNVTRGGGCTKIIFLSQSKVTKEVKSKIYPYVNMLKLILSFLMKYSKQETVNV